MGTSGRTEIIETATVESAIKNAEGDTILKLQLDSISKYPQTCNDKFAIIKVAEMPAQKARVLVKMVRGRLKEGKDGAYDSDYFWELAEWATSAQAPAPVTSVAGQPNSAPVSDGARGQQGDYRRSKEQVSWEGAVDAAVHLHGPVNPEHVLTGDAQYSFALLQKMAADIYDLYTAGPPQQQAQDAPEPPVESVTEHRGGVDFDKLDQQPRERPAPVDASGLSPKPVEVIAEALNEYNGRVEATEKVAPDILTLWIQEHYIPDERPADWNRQTPWPKLVPHLSPEQLLELSAQIAQGEVK